MPTMDELNAAAQAVREAKEEIETAKKRVDDAEDLMFTAQNNYAAANDAFRQLCRQLVDAG